MKETITIMNNGNETKANIIASFTLDEFKKDYIIYTFEDSNENEMLKIHTSTLIETKDNYQLEKIETEEEWQAIKKFMRETNQIEI